MADVDAFAQWVSDAAKAEFRAAAQQPPPPTDISAARLHYDAYNRRQLDSALSLHAADITAETWGGVPVHIVTPSEGATDPRVLMCLHGGAFMWGSGDGALLEAVPVACATGMTVFAVDYRLAPEHVFPAAVEDAVAVYGRLLESHAAAGIGIYGCSAGAMLTAQAVARLIFDQRPLPGAIAMLHGAGLEIEGDSVAASRLFDPRPDPGAAPKAGDMPYFMGADLRDPLVLPGYHPSTLAQFPPSLLVTGTRDFFASACSTMHRRLLAAGAEASFVEFDGMWHAHHMAVALPESRETFALLARHFATHLRSPG